MTVTIRDMMKINAKARYSMQAFKGKTLLEWTVLWFKMSNDNFFKLYGFNFNPHEYPMLYEIAREEVYGAESENIIHRRGRM